MDLKPNWDLLAHLASLNDVKNDGFSTIFTSTFQAHLPNPDNPPLYADLPAHREGGRVVIDSKLTARLRDSFFLESLVPQYADNLKSLRGSKFDWSRNDGIWDHVFANHALTHKLNELALCTKLKSTTGFGTQIPAGARRVASLLMYCHSSSSIGNSSRDEHCDLTAQLSARFVTILKSVRCEP